MSGRPRGRARGRARGGIDEQQARQPEETEQAAAVQPPPVMQPHEPQAQPPSSGSPSGHGGASESHPGIDESEGPHVPTELSAMTIGTGAAPKVVYRTRPDHIVDKRGTSGNRLSLITNYFKLVRTPEWHIYQYYVDFNPVVDSKKMRIALLYQYEHLLGRTRAFDGKILFLPIRLREQTTEFYTKRNTDDVKIRIRITMTNELRPNSPQCIQVYNIIFRRVLTMINMKQIGRNYYNPSLAKTIDKHKLTVLPGFITSILQCENDILLNCDISHKIMRSDSVLDQMADISRRNEAALRDDATRLLVGSIVLTRYNNRTYRVDDIAWDKRPDDTFKLHDGSEISYKEYYKKHYEKDITDDNQPLLVSKPKEKDIRGGQKDNIYLVPELCNLTGLTDWVRADASVMRDVSNFTRVVPDKRYGDLLAFVRQINSNQNVRTMMEDWRLRFSQDLLSLNGRILPKQILLEKEDKEVSYEQNANWSEELKKMELTMAVELENWVIIYPTKCSGQAQSFVQDLIIVGLPMGMKIAQPNRIDKQVVTFTHYITGSEKQKPVLVEHFRSVLVGTSVDADVVELEWDILKSLVYSNRQINDDRNDSYLSELQNSITSNTQLVMCLLPTNKKDRYDAIKKFTCVDRPVPSQVIVSHTLNRKDRMKSVATKVAIQLNCKLGGEVWALKIPLKSLMVIGMDVYHDSATEGRSVAGIIASMNSKLTKYYSRVIFQNRHQELVDGLARPLVDAMTKYCEINGNLPEHIIVFRDGVGDGQLQAVKEHEVPQMLKSFKTTGGEDYNPKVGVVIVKKRINSRFFARVRQQLINPPAGTIVDTGVTKPEWYDFFLVSQSVRQGTVSPTHYNVILDNTGLRPDHFQRLAYKLCHLYYNWSGTISVPAPCQYAHKLAFLVGQSLHVDPPLNLADKLYFL